MKCPPPFLEFARGQLVMRCFDVVSVLAPVAWTRSDVKSIQQQEQRVGEASGQVC